MFAFSSQYVILSWVLLLVPTMTVSEVIENFTCHMIDDTDLVPVAVSDNEYTVLAMNLISGEDISLGLTTINWKGSNRFSNKVVYRREEHVYSHDDETGLTSLVGSYTDVNNATHQEAVALFKTSKDPDEFERKAKGKGELGHAVKFTVIDGTLCDTRFCYSEDTCRWTISNSRTSFDDGIYFQNSIFELVETADEAKVNVYFRSGNFSHTIGVPRGYGGPVHFFTNKTDMNMVRISNNKLIVHNFQTGFTARSGLTVMHRLDGIVLPCRDSEPAEHNEKTAVEGSSTVGTEILTTYDSGDVKLPPIITTVFVAMICVVFTNT